MLTIKLLYYWYMSVDCSRRLLLPKYTYTLGINSIVLLTNVNHVIDPVYCTDLCTRVARDTWIITAGLGPVQGILNERRHV